MNVRLADTAAQYRRLRAEIDAALARVLESGSYIGGPENEALERELAAYLGVKEVVGVNSGTDALLLTLKALGIGAGDEVIVPSYTFFASAEAVSLAGAQPRFADCAPGSFNVDVTGIERAWTANVKAVIVVHLFGEAVDVAPIEAFCRERNLHLIEDAAQALGATYRGRRVGSLGTAAALSFYPTKTLAACGDGGAISCNDTQLAARLRILRNHGRESAGKHIAIGHNSRLDEIQAAILRVKLRYLDDWNLRRCAIAAQYCAGLRDTRCEHLVREQSVYCQFVVSHPERDALRAFLAANGIETAIYYSVPCHLQMPYRGVHEILSLPLAERYSRQALALPIHPELADAEVARIVALVHDFEQR